MASTLEDSPDLGLDARPELELRRARPEPERLAFEIVEGDVENHFVREARVAAHVLVSRGLAPRLIVAFPAGNSGAGIWFDELPAPADLALEGQPAPVETDDGLRGVTMVLRSSAPALSIGAAALGSVRGLRARAHGRDAPAAMAHDLDVGPPVVLRRRTADGRRSELTLEPLAGGLARVGADGRVVLDGGGGPIRFRVTALADDPPLTPIDEAALFTPDAADSTHERRALAFLAYEEKLCAGSWRFLTYFGRDTLLSARLLMPALAPSVVEAALGSVLERVADDGSVAHEEDVGEWPAMSGEPSLDYKMVDDDFLLAPVVEHYLLDTAAGWERCEPFLDRRAPSGASYRDVLRRNLDLVLARAAPFAETPRLEHLVWLKDGHEVGQWRDSVEGLGGGRVPFDVNVALVPAALRAAERLYVLLHDADAAARAARFARGWERAAGFFDVEVPVAEAAERIGAYAAELGMDASAALASLVGPVRFAALALDRAGRPLPIMHSDDGFVLLFTHPPARVLEAVARRLLMPFPAGLRTPVGVVVANPAFCPDPDVRGLFTARHYHGTVVWSWQQAMLAAGLRRQLARPDLPDETRRALTNAETSLWRVIHETRAMSTSELWSFTVRGGKLELCPFGQGRGDTHTDESNAVQLWSTVYLAVRPAQ